MIIYYIALIIIIISALSYTAENNSDYLSFKTTNAVKGIFILLIFASHIIPYISNAIGSGGENKTNVLLDNIHIGQWVVAMFLFYSGFGVMESIRKKGKDYILAIPKRRILGTLINFDIAVIIFMIVGLLLGKPLEKKQCLLALTGWESVGNSNWYIFIILLCYGITFISFYRQRNHIKAALYCLSGLLITTLLLSLVKDDYWYNTMLCYGSGILFSIYREKIENYTKLHYWKTLILLLFSLAGVGCINYEIRGLGYNLFTILFCATIILLTMRLNINSCILTWCGKNLFPLYIYQRLPMIILATIDNGTFVANYPTVYIFICLLATLAITYLHKYWNIKIQ